MTALAIALACLISLLIGLIQGRLLDRRHAIPMWMCDCCGCVGMNTVNDVGQPDYCYACRTHASWERVWVYTRERA